MRLTPAVIALTLALPAASRAAGEPELAADPALRHVAVDLSLVPAVSVNGEGRVLNHLSIGIVARSTVLRGLAIAPAHLAEEDVDGVQITWAAATAGGTVRGLQLASLTTVARGLRGVQVSQIANVARGEARGLQLGGAVNWARRLEGAQLGLLNVSPSLAGVQLALVNAGGDVAGTQVGLVNLARRVRGAQLGLVNLAEEADGSIGLVSLVRHGRRELELFATELTPLAAGVRLGGARAYGVLVGGVQAEDLERSGKRLWTLGGGAGVGFRPGPRLALDLDVVAQAVSLDGDEEAVLGSVRAVAAWRLARRLALFAGPTASVFVSDEDQPDVHLGWRLDARRYARVWPGLVAGVRL